MCITGFLRNLLTFCSYVCNNTGYLCSRKSFLLCNFYEYPEIPKLVHLLFFPIQMYLCCWMEFHMYISSHQRLVSAHVNGLRWFKTFATQYLKLRGFSSDTSISLTTRISPRTKTWILEVEPLWVELVIATPDYFGKEISELSFSCFLLFRRTVCL